MSPPQALEFFLTVAGCFVFAVIVGLWIGGYLIYRVWKNNRKS